MADLTSMGFGEGEIIDSVARLLKWKMLACDGETGRRLEDLDKIKITPSGFIHLMALPHFVEYLSSAAVFCSLRTDVARRIANYWEVASRVSDLDFAHKYDVVAELANYLVSEKVRLDALNPVFRTRCRQAERLIQAVTHTVNTNSSKAARERAENARAATERRKASGSLGKARRGARRPRHM